MPEFRVVQLDARTLRALAHPLRVQALGLLRRHGPSTATRLGERMGHSSGVLSYHLRQLEAHGLVVEDDARGNGRERWWRAGHDTTTFDSDMIDASSDPDVQAAGIEYFRAVGGIYAQRLAHALDGLDTLADDVGAERAKTFDLSDWPLHLTPERALAMLAELDAVLDRYRATPDDGPTAGPITVQRQVLPGIS